MGRAIRPFVLEGSNLESVTALYASVGSGAAILITGPRGAGKTTMAENFISHEKENGDAMHCSAAELSSAVYIKENDALLERVGNVPALAIDDIEQFSSCPSQGHLLSLLIAERKRQERCSVALSNVSIDELEDLLPEADLSVFDKVFRFEALSKEGLQKYAVVLVDFYKTKSSPVFDEEVIEWVAEATNWDLHGIDSAIRFLSTASGLCKNDFVTVETARSLTGLQ